VRRYLRTRLPEYMIPAFAVPLDAVPLSASGKIDRNALPDPFDQAVNPSGAFEEPLAGPEAAIADRWRQLLKVNRVGADDNFFDLGGDSLLALRFVAGIEREIGTRIDPRNLFFQNLRQIAAAVGELSRPREHRSP
jgi:acyl carrier protein